jgi:glycosyltransferase involved in cell wall biosynthesis
MATGTPVIARRAGALTETVEHGVDGYLVDDLDEAVLATGKIDDLDRTEVRRRAVERFSRGRMVDEYESVYADLLQMPARRTPLSDRLEVVSGSVQG